MRTAHRFVLRFVRAVPVAVPVTVAEERNPVPERRGGSCGNSIVRSIARIILHSERAGSGAPTPDPRVAGPGRRRRNRELMRRFHAATVHAAQLTKPNRTNRPRTQSASRVPPRVAYAACSLDRSMHHVHAAACSFGLGMHHVHAALVQLLHPCARRVARTTA